MTSTNNATGERPSRLIGALLGDYWFDTRDYVPSAALAALLAEFDVSPQATRAILSRSCRRGWLERHKTGRTTAYRLAADARAQVLAYSRKLMAFGITPTAWDGHWTCIAFSVPEADRTRRLALRRQLVALHFGKLFDALWISPHPPTDELHTALHTLDIADLAVFRATAIPRTNGVDLLSAWDLDKLRASYHSFLATLSQADPHIVAGTMGSAAALTTRTAILTGWGNLAIDDPQLPDELLPDDWPRDEARTRFTAAYDQLGPVAEARVRQLTAPYDTPPPRHHKVSDILTQVPKPA